MVETVEMFEMEKVKGVPNCPGGKIRSGGKGRGLGVGGGAGPRGVPIGDKDRYPEGRGRRRRF